MSTTAQHIEASPGVWVSIITIFASFWNVHVVLLFILIILASIFDLLTGARRASLRKRMGLPGGFDRERMNEGLVTKVLLTLTIIVIGVSVDAILKVITGTANLEIGEWVNAYNPVLTILLAWYWARETTSILENLAATPGSEGAVWPGVRNLINSIRYRLTGKNPPENSEPVPWFYDLPDTTQERIRRVLEEEVPPPANPTVRGSAYGSGD